MSRSRILCDVLTIGLFLAGLCAPVCEEFFGEVVVEVGETEFRTPARAPRFPQRRIPFSKAGSEFLLSEEGLTWLFSKSGLRWLMRYPERYQEYHSDSFGFRNELLRAHSALSWRVLGISPNPVAIRGREDWIFTDANHELAVWRGAAPFSQEETEAWARSLRARRAFYKARGIEYVLCVAPDKENVYPERMPHWAEHGDSRLEQLLRELGDDQDVLIPLLEPLLAEKARDRDEDFVYRRLGSHWTERGAKVASECIADRLRSKWQAIPKRPIEEYERVEAELDLPDDMGLRLRVSDQVLGERREYDLVPSTPNHSSRISIKDRNVTTTNSLPGLPKAWVQHDSFGRELQPFLAEALGDSGFYWGYGVDVGAVLAQQPDVLIEVIVERALNFLPPTIPRDAGDSKLAARFEASNEVLLSVPDEQPWEMINPNDRVRLARNGEALELDGVRLGPAVWLPAFRCPVGRDIVLRIEVVVAEADELRVAYATKQFPEFEPRTSIAQSLTPGPNVLHIELLAPELCGPILLMPFQSGRSCVLRAIEARAVAR